MSRASEWVDHLRAGGETPWAHWGGHDPASGSGRQPTGPPLPGAQQLELLRRLNAAGRPSRGLAAAVLDASPTGRGRPDLELVGATRPSRFGPPPVDPAALPETELLRIAVGLLADHVLARALPPAVAPPRARPWRRRYRIVGDPVRAQAMRDVLIARGRPPGGRYPVVVVMAGGLEEMIGHVFRARLVDTGAPPWPDWVAQLRARDQVPPRVDLLRAAERWAHDVGRRRVRVVTDPTAVPRLVGVRGPLPEPAPLHADALELARQVAVVLGVLAHPHERARLIADDLLPRLSATLPGGGPRVPEAHRAWLRDQALRLRDGLSDAGYAVHGDPDRLIAEVPEPAASDGVLALAVRQLLRDDREAGEETP